MDSSYFRTLVLGFYLLHKEYSQNLIFFEENKKTQVTSSAFSR